MFYNFWNIEHAEQGITHLNISSNNVIDNIRYISVSLLMSSLKLNVLLPANKKRRGKYITNIWRKLQYPNF